MVCVTELASQEVTKTSTTIGRDHHTLELCRVNWIRACFFVLWLSMAVGCREEQPQASRSEEASLTKGEPGASLSGEIFVTPGDVAHLQRSIWSRKEDLDTMFEDVCSQAIKDLVAGMRSSGATADSVQQYLTHLYAGNLLRTVKAVKSFGDLPAEARKAVEPAVFSLTTHNELGIRRAAVRELLNHSSADVREQVCRLYLSPSLVISKWTVKACDDEAVHDEVSLHRRERLKLILDRQWRSTSVTPGKPFKATWEAPDQFLLPEDERKMQLRAMEALVRDFCNEPNNALLEDLTGYLYSRDWKIRRATLAALRDAPAPSYEMFGPFAISFVTDEHPSVRIAAVELLCAQAREQTKELRWMLRFSPYEEVSEAARCEVSP